MITYSFSLTWANGTSYNTLEGIVKADNKEDAINKIIDYMKSNDVDKKVPLPTQDDLIRDDGDVIAFESGY